MCVSMMKPVRAEPSLHVGCAIHLRVLEGVSSAFTSGLTCLIKYEFFLSAPAGSVNRERTSFLWLPGTQQHLSRISLSKEPYKFLLFKNIKF